MNDHNSKTCPNCGYCPHCGRSAQPYRTLPVYPWPGYYGGWWQIPSYPVTYPGGSTWTTAGNQPVTYGSTVVVDSTNLATGQSVTFTANA